MKTKIQTQAGLILAGLAALPAMTAVADENGNVQINAYCAPYADECPRPAPTNPNHELSVTTGLAVSELEQAKQLVTDLNRLDVISANSMNLTQAPRIPYMYNMPDPDAVDAARSKNLERLAKLRAIIEAAAK